MKTLLALGTYLRHTCRYHKIQVTLKDDVKIEWWPALGDRVLSATQY